jgi:hypothetical protein
MKTSLYYNNIVSAQKKLTNKVLFTKSYLKNFDCSKTSYTIDNYYNTSFFRSKKIAQLPKPGPGLVHCICCAADPSMGLKHSLFSNV